MMEEELGNLHSFVMQAEDQGGMYFYWQAIAILNYKKMQSEAIGNIKAIGDKHNQ